MNNQQIDRILNFFRINYQFHDPYQFLLDGNFIKLLVEKGIDIKRKFQNSTKGRVVLRVTSCILKELELLGDDFKLVLEEAKKYKAILCKHSLEYSVDSCIVDQIGEKNERYFMVCSQDLELRRHLRTLENVPIIYFGPDQRITMEDIPKDSLKEINKKMQKKFLPNQKEAALVKEYNERLQRQERKRQIRELSSQFGIQIKTKIAKGPNPLSVKRKQHKEAISRPKNQENGAPEKKKRIRKRKNSQPQSSNPNPASIGHQTQ